MKFLKGRTVADSVSLEGVGIHTGEISKITIHPSAKRGIFFYKKGVKIPALHHYVANTTAGTDLRKDGEWVKTVEHLMAALYLLGIDSAVVEVEGSEIPIADGSAKPFIELIQSVGIEELDHPQVYLKVVFPDVLKPNGIFERIRPYEGERFIYDGFFPYIGRRWAVYEGEVSEALIGARTYIDVETVPFMWLNNLGKGGSLVNTLPLNENCDYLVYSSEPAYHKLLDLIGDMALLGARLLGELYSFGGNHTLNHFMRERILKMGIAQTVVPEGELV